MFALSFLRWLPGNPKLSLSIKRAVIRSAQNSLVFSSNPAAL
jgi:hypothetical protein